MISTAMQTSFTSEETIKCSQELDQLIIHYQTYKILENRVGFYQSVLNTISLFVMQPILSINKIK
ncbi:aspartyl-phosphate phosphatase Spo0E family protein [Bacillus mesophilus]|uniref:Aspartyl-phosphate phosphatase Spo0E family protein n=2 Tax=Bacillus mesophilus TaxID=1808955 RepID=A0A6M0Q2T6_9BACI|nr:aspartyl-phosphate phosphatase Spo0E family protein [Bacillus mesophilus]